MTYHSLRDFLKDLEQRALLKRVAEPVSPVLEMTEIGTRLIAAKGPAVLLENVVGHSMPALMNLFGTVERVALGMNRTPETLRELGQSLAFLRQPEPPQGLKQAWEMLPLLKSALHMKPRTVSRAPCQDMVLRGDEIDLAKLPIQTCWPGDAGPLITWPLVVTGGPGFRIQDSGREKSSFPESRIPNPEPYNLGIYRMQVLNKNQTLMRWLKHRGGAQHHARWGQSKCEPLPAAAVIGADPATTLAAVTPLPETFSEYHYAGVLRGEKTELVDCVSVPLKVPANAEIVLEGTVSLEDYRPEGPFGDHTGYYNDVEPFPVFTLSAITMRANPIYHTTYTGKPPDEPSVLGEALNEVMIPLLQQQFPEITDCYLPPEGCSYRIAVISMRKAYPGHAKRVMMGMWSFLRQFLYTKILIIVDDDIDVRNWKEVMWAISTRMDPVRDITLLSRTPIDYLDFASPESGLGGKMAMDATHKLPPETSRRWGELIHMDKAVKQKIDAMWEKLGLGS